MRKFIKRAIFSKTLAKLLIKPILRGHSICYNMAGRYAIILNGGVHPKHRVLKYKEWFLDNIEPGWIVLDIGCNTGMLPYLLAKKAAYVYGIETDKTHIYTAIKQYTRNNIEYICADATTYDYSKCRPVDCVTMSNVLEHIEDRIDFLKKIISNVTWADKDTKRFLFRVPMFDREWLVPYKKEMGIEYCLDPGHYIEYTIETFTNELNKAGINIISTIVRFGEIYAVCQAAAE